MSGEELTDSGHYWVGLDISKDMIDVAVEREVEGDLLVHDMGQGVPFKPGTFDGVIRCDDSTCANDRKCFRFAMAMQR